MPTVDINLWEVFMCGIASMALGSWWFSPAGFGKAWMKEMGISMESITEEKKKGMAKNYAIMFVGSLVMAYVLSHFVDYAQATTVQEGMQAGFWAWLGFIATVGLGMVLWESKSWKLYAITMGYELVLLLIMGAILAAWV